MRILSISLQNIKSHRDTRLEFSPGINVLSGPNGAGKSTIFEAIGYGLFGVEAQKFVGNAERFLSIGAKKGQVSIIFELDNGERYQVSRTVGSAARWLLYKEVGGAFEVEDHKDARETEGRLKKLLGLDNGRSLAEQFELVIGPFQNDFLGPFIVKQATRRRDEFDAILGIDAWRKTFSETGNLFKFIQQKIEVLEAEIRIRREQLAVLPEKLTEQQKVLADLDQTEKAFAAKTTELANLEVQLGALDSQEQAMNALQGVIGQLDGRILDGGQKIEVQLQRVSEAEQSSRLVEASRVGKDAFEKTEALLVQLRIKEKQRRTLEQEVSGLNAQVKGLKGQLDAETRSIEVFRQELVHEEQRLSEAAKSVVIGEELLTKAGGLAKIKEELSGQRSRQGMLKGRRAGLEEGREKLSGGNCPFFQEACRNVAEQKTRDVFTIRVQALDEELENLNAGLEILLLQEAEAEQARAEIKAAEVQRRALAQQAEALLRRKEDLASRQKSLEKSIRSHGEALAEFAARKNMLMDFEGLEQAIEKAEQEKKRHQPVRDAFYTHLQQAEDLVNRRETLEKYNRLLKELKADLSSKKECLQKMAQGYDKALHDRERRQKELLLGELGTLGQQITGFRKDHQRLGIEIGRLEELKREVDEKSAAVGELMRKEKLVKFLRNKVFKNVSAHLSERFREEISQRADRIYRTIAENDEELVWGDNYQVVLRDLVDGQLRERTDDQLSGGQMMSAVVALRLALLQTIGAKMAFFDEPTSNLDTARRENLALAFRSIDIGREEVTDHWYDQLFLISHDIAFTEITDQVISLGE